MRDLAFLAPFLVNFGGVFFSWKRFSFSLSGEA
jgi:hypothetical protein